MQQPQVCHDHLPTIYLHPCVFLQIWSFLRSDVSYEKQQVLAIRLEKVPSLKPATIHYVNTMVRDRNFGVPGERKEFLECLPEGKVIQKVIIH